MSRYKVTGNWQTLSGMDVERNSDGEIFTVVIEGSDLVDERCHVTYEDGARRVRVLDKGTGIRPKTFRGEMAWAQAESYFRDVVYTIQRSVEVFQ